MTPQCIHNEPINRRTRAWRVECLFPRAHAAHVGGAALDGMVQISRVEGLDWGVRVKARAAPVGSEALDGVILILFRILPGC